MPEQGGSKNEIPPGKRPPPDDGWTQDENLDRVDAEGIDRDWTRDHEVERADKRLGRDA